LSRTRQPGASLLELLLVLAIVSSLMVLGLNFYRGYQNQLYFSEIQQQIGIIFDAMRMYYYANCQSGRALGTVVTTPKVVLSGGVTTLVNYLDTPVQPNNPWVNFSDTNTYHGYIAQFNPHSANRSGVGSATYVTGTTTYYASGTIGTIVSWTSQVAVELTSNQNALDLKAYLGAECTSTFTSAAAGVALCTSSSANVSTDTYIVLENAPSYGSGHNTINSTYMPMLKEFKIPYENSEWQGFQPSTAGKAVNSSGNYATDYYYCGS
jgi:type II secretory pathway pseudopilin PulG